MTEVTLMTDEVTLVTEVIEMTDEIGLKLVHILNFKRGPTKQKSQMNKRPHAASA